MNYRNRETGEIFSIEELTQIWNHFGYESKYETFEDMLDDLEETEEMR